MIKLAIAAFVLATITGQTLTDSGSELETWLPAEEGYTWNYFGFAEYGHTMTLTDIISNGTETVYIVEGMVEDVSGGEAQRDFSINLKYTVTDSTLTLSQRAPMIMGSDFQQMELLRLPVEEGASWTQTVADQDGNVIELLCVIEGKTDQTLTVRYSDTQSEFYHLREFETGTGTITFEKIFMSPEGNFEVGYTLYRPEEY